MSEAREASGVWLPLGDALDGFTGDQVADVVAIAREGALAAVAQIRGRQAVDQ